MEQDLSLDLETYFAAVDDPQAERTKRHKRLDSMIIAICGMTCGAEGWGEMEAFGKEKEAWLKTILELPTGLPSHGTFGRVFARLDPVKFEECFWKSGAKYQCNDSRSDRHRGQNPASFSCWGQGEKGITHGAAENRPVLAQVAVEEKSNSISLSLMQAVVTDQPPGR